MDSDHSPSWEAAAGAAAGRHEWLFSWPERRLVHTLPTGAQVVPFAERERRLVVHGGGWGIGSYREFLEEGLRHGFGCDVRRYFPEDEIPRATGLREFEQCADWEPWDVDAAGRHTFPTLCMRTEDGLRPVSSPPAYHNALELIRGAMAVVIKPGGATLLDSVETATPIVFLTPYGAHEEKNLRLWEELGFGIRLEEWCATGFSLEPLERCHENLRRARMGLPAYPERLLERLRQEVPA